VTRAALNFAPGVRGFSPFRLAFGRDPVTPLDAAFQPQMIAPEPWASDIAFFREAFKRAAADALDHARRSAAASADRGHHIRSFVVGDIVMLWHPPPRRVLIDGLSTKISPKLYRDTYSGPWEVVKVHSFNTYSLKATVGTGKAPPRPVHVARLKRYHDPELARLEPTYERVEADDETIDHAYLANTDYRRRGLLVAVPRPDATSTDAAPATPPIPPTALTPPTTIRPSLLAPDTSVPVPAPAPAPTVAAPPDPNTLWWEASASWRKQHLPATERRQPKPRVPVSLASFVLGPGSALGEGCKAKTGTTHVRVSAESAEHSAEPVEWRRPARPSRSVF